MRSNLESWGSRRQPRVPLSDLWHKVLGACLAGVVLLGARLGAADDDSLPAPAGGSITFEKHVAPVLQASCLGCHGPKKSGGGLRLDTREGALSGGEHGPAIVPGKSAESLLILAVAGLHGEVRRMPRKGDPLTRDTIAVLRAWIDQGAEWARSSEAKKKGADHWAFKAPVKPAVPTPRGSHWVKNPIDAFVLARLEKEGLTPSPPAEPLTLCRRLHLDLLGLPPDPDAAEAFAGSSSPEAYDQLVEELLRSPHLGERWARTWLDAARYADSDGFEKDKTRFVWAYRDWVVGALNRDLPYDEFIIEQIAGDLLPDATADQQIATGFLRNSMLNEEGGVDPEQFRMDGLFDRMDCIGKSILGLTIQCSQCHDHKFDPLTQEEYYRLFAFINNDHESSTVAYTPAQEMERANLLRQMREIEEGLRRSTPGWEEQMAAWEDSVRNDQPQWTVVRCENAGDNGERYYYHADGSVRAASYAPTQWTMHLRGTSREPRITGFRLEQLTDPNLPCGGPGRSIKGMAALSELKVTATDAADPSKKIEVKLVKATADYSNPLKDLEPEFDDRSGRKRTYGPVVDAIDGKFETGWGIDAGPGRRNQPRKAVFVAEKPIEFQAGAVLDFRYELGHGGWNSDDNQNHNLGRFRMSVTAAPDPVADPLPAGVREIFEIPRERRSPAQVAAVFSYWRTTVPAWRSANDQIEALWRRWPEGTPTLVLAKRSGKGPGEEHRETMIFKRGDWLKPDRKVAAGVPAALHSLPADAGSTRLDLARWLVDRRAPTTARVIVNRIWQVYFGTGIVETSEDLGTQSPPPSHPELLDWLACELMDRGWSLKALHRLIVTSATYRQSSRVTPELLEKDPFNRLFARGPRLRVEAEGVRDVALAVSGLLDRSLGGPSVHPPAPAFLFEPPASYGPKPWIEAQGSDRYRRGLYTFRYRSSPYPFLATFDAPNGDFSCVRRTRSNTPLQALMTLNETLSMECAQGLARQALEKGGATDPGRIELAFRRALGRRPSPTERAELLAYLERQKKHLGEGWVNVRELATGKNEPFPVPAGATPTELAAYTALARVLLNLDETITKE